MTDKNTRKKRTESSIDARSILGKIENKQEISNALKEIKTHADMEKLRDYLISELHKAITNGDENETNKKLKELASSHLSSVSRGGGGYSLVNTHIILKQLPTATALATARKWKKLGYHPIDGVQPVYVPASGAGRYRVPNIRDDKGKWRRQSMPLLSEYQKNKNLSNKEMAETLGISEKTYDSYKYGTRLMTETEYNAIASGIGAKVSDYPYNDWKDKFRWSQGGGRILELYDVSTISPDDPNKKVPRMPKLDTSEAVYSAETINRFISNIMQDNKIAFKTDVLAVPYSVTKEPMGGVVCTVNKNIDDPDRRNFASLCGLCAAIAVKQYAGPSGTSKKLDDNLPAIANLAAYITALRYDIPCGGAKDCIEACGRGISVSNLGMALDTALNIGASVATDLSGQICDLTQDTALSDYLDLFEDRNVKKQEKQSKEIMYKQEPAAEPAFAFTEENVEEVQDEQEAEKVTVPAEEYPDFDDLMFF